MLHDSSVQVQDVLNNLSILAYISVDKTKKHSKNTSEIVEEIIWGTLWSLIYEGFSRKI